MATRSSASLPNLTLFMICIYVVNVFKSPGPVKKPDPLPLCQGGPLKWSIEMVLLDKGGGPLAVEDLLTNCVRVSYYNRSLLFCVFFLVFYLHFGVK